MTTFFLQNHDHTVGNCVSYGLNQHVNVEYAAYKIPHENLPQFQMTVRTNSKQTPSEAILDSIEYARKEFRSFRHQFIMATKNECKSI